MSTKLHPWQVTGNIAKTYHDMLFQKNNTKFDKNSVFGEGYFDLQSPARSFRRRNHSLMAGSANKKMTPMRIKEQLRKVNDYNYSTRKFVLQSDKQVDSRMPTDLSVANLLFEKSKQARKYDQEELPGTIQLLNQNSSFVRDPKDILRTLEKRASSLPPPRPQIEEQALPELNATKAKIEMHKSRSPMRNVSILIQRGKTNESALTVKTPSYMNNDSRLSINADITPPSDKKKSKLPPLKRAQQTDSLDPDNQLGIKVALPQKMFNLEARHRSPKELLQENLIERALAKNTKLRAGTDLDKIRRLSVLTGAIHANDSDLRVIYSPRPHANEHSVEMLNAIDAPAQDIVPVELPQTTQQIDTNIVATLEQSLSSEIESSAYPLARVHSKPSKRQGSDLDVVQDKQYLGGNIQYQLKAPQIRNAEKIPLPGLQSGKSVNLILARKFESQRRKQGRRAPRQPSKHHQTVTHVPSPHHSRRSPSDVQSRLMSTQNEKFLDTQRIPFRRNSKLSNQHPSAEQGLDHSRIMIKGSSGQLSLDGADAGQIQKAERDAFKDFTRTAHENMHALKLDPEVEEEMARQKTNINIKDIDFGLGRSKLKITTGRRGSAASMVSRDSNPREDDDDYYEEMHLRSKLKPKRKARKSPGRGEGNLEDKVETDGQQSALDKTMSSLGKHAQRLSPKRQMIDQGPTPSPRLQGRGDKSADSRKQTTGSPPMLMQTPSVLHLNSKGGKHMSRMQPDGSRGALTIMNMTFNEEVSAQNSPKHHESPTAKKPYNTNAFKSSTKLRLANVYKQNRHMKEQFEEEPNEQPAEVFASRKSLLGSKRGNPSSPKHPTSNAMENTNKSNFVKKREGSKVAAGSSQSESKASPLSSLQIFASQKHTGYEEKGKSKDPQQANKPLAINIKMQPATSVQSPTDQIRADTQLKIRGKIAPLERRPDSNPQLQLVLQQEQHQVKVLIENAQHSPQDIDDELGRTQRDMNIDINEIDRNQSSMTINRVADDMKELLLHEDPDELDSPMKIPNQPKLGFMRTQQQSQSAIKGPPRNKSRLEGGGGSKVSVKSKVSPSQATSKGHRKRKTTMQKTNGGVEPWGNKDRVMKQQSLLSFADLENGEDDDQGPMMKDNDSAEFILRQDNSVQQIQMGEKILEGQSSQQTLHTRQKPQTQTAPFLKGGSDSSQGVAGQSK